MARAIFSAWDHSEKGYLTFKELSEELVTLGLSTENSFVERLMYAIKAKKLRKATENRYELADPEAVEEPQVNIELLTLKDFLKVFEYDRFGDKACKVIANEFSEKLAADMLKLA